MYSFFLLYPFSMHVCPSPFLNHLTTNETTLVDKGAYPHVHMDIIATISCWLIFFGAVTCVM